ncbi:MAG: type II toxin-antitoxin system HicB family antitoxin [Bacteroidota bacterium]
MTYRVALHKTDEGYAVLCPGLPGCWSEGQAEEVALANIRDAITEYLDVAHELAEQDEAEVREVEILAQLVRSKSGLFGGYSPSSQQRAGWRPIAKGRCTRNQGRDEQRFA